MTVLVSDSFNRVANATSLGSTDSYNGGTSKAWTVSGSGAYGIDSTGNYAYCSTAPSSGHNVAYVNAGVSDGIIQATMVTLEDYNGGGPKLSFRIQDSENMINCQVMTTNILVYYYKASAATTLAQWNGTVNNGDTVAVKANGTAITVYLNGTQVLTTTDTSPFVNNTNWGIMSYHYQTARFDNFMVQDLLSTTSVSGKATSVSLATGNVVVTGTSSVSGKVASYSLAKGSVTVTNTAAISVSSTVQSSSVGKAIANKNTGLPNVNKTVVVIMENHSQSELQGNPSAPYFNSLLSNGANFKNMAAIEHPSQPNYFDIFSGNNQGVTDDNYVTAYSLTTSNLYTVLNTAGRSFMSYNEDMPYIGFTGDTYNNYASKHNPWTKFSNVPSSVNVPFSGYWMNTPGASTDFSTLSDVSFIVPNLINDIHDGTISDGDNWLKTYVDPYVQWAKSNNSLLIITFDEDDNTGGNIVPFVMVGPMVKQMTNNTSYNHYSLLRTVIDLYGGQSYPSNSVSAMSISDAWAADVSTSTASYSSSSRGNVTVSKIVSSKSISNSVATSNVTVSKIVSSKSISNSVVEGATVSSIAAISGKAKSTSSYVAKVTVTKFVEGTAYSTSTQTTTINVDNANKTISGKVVSSSSAKSSVAVLKPVNSLVVSKSTAVTATTVHGQSTFRQTIELTLLLESSVNIVLDI